MLITKKIKLKLVGLDGNAFSLLGSFSKQAKRENWTSEEISFVLEKAQSGNYDNLLNVLSSYCDEGGF